MAEPRPLQTVPFRGGCNTVVDPTLLPPGAYSMVQNMRNDHPGMKARKGQIALHTTADSTNKVLSLYGFSKGRRVENHLLAQMSDGDILQATALPPAVTTGVFGSELYDGGASQIPGSWANLYDLLMHSNGVDQHQVWAGTLAYVQKFVVYESANALPRVPAIGKDYTDKVTDAIAANVGVLGAVGTNATDALCICTQLNPNSLKFTIGGVNAVVATMTVAYWNGAWTGLTKTDNTAVAGATLAQTGTVTWTAPADAIPTFMYGKCGYWLKITFSAALSAGCTIAEVEFSAPMQSIKNIWDGVLVDAIEAQVYLNATTAYRVYGGAAVTVGGLTSSDYVYFAAADNAEAIFIDVGSIPNVVASTTINALQYWNGTTWVTVGTFVDGTTGLSKSGWLTFARLSATQPLEFNNCKYYAVWYRFTVDKTITAGMTIWIQYQPYFDVSELGISQCCAAWKGRAVYSFNRWPDYLYITAQNQAQTLNGNDYGIIQVGDGRAHKVVAMRKFHNELMAWQEERGEEGGCLTLIEGYSPATYGKLILSSRLGAMNAKSVAVVDGVLTSTATDEIIKTLAFALSRYGVYVSDGRTCSLISDDIQNYFDPNNSNCIRRGYEDQMWLAYDSAYNVIRLGLVSGASATLPNVFPVFDLVDKTWSFDVLGQELSCAIEMGAGSGQAPVVQVGGGIDDGLVYLLNSSDNDVAIAVDAYAMMEIDFKGLIFNLREMILRTKAQTGNLTLTPYINSIAQTAKTLSMAAEIANQTIRRNRFPLNLNGHHISLKFDHATVSQGVTLQDVAMRLIPYVEQ